MEDNAVPGKEYRWNPFFFIAFQNGSIRVWLKIVNHQKITLVRDCNMLGDDDVASGKPTIFLLYFLYLLIIWR